VGVVDVCVDFAPVGLGAVSACVGVVMYVIFLLFIVQGRKMTM